MMQRLLLNILPKTNLLRPIFASTTIAPPLLPCAVTSNPSIEHAYAYALCINMKFSSTPTPTPPNTSAEAESALTKEFTLNDVYVFYEHDRFSRSIPMIMAKAAACLHDHGIVSPLLKVVIFTTEEKKYALSKDLKVYENQTPPYIDGNISLQAPQFKGPKAVRNLMKERINKIKVESLTDKCKTKPKMLMIMDDSEDQNLSSFVQTLSKTHKVFLVLGGTADQNASLIANATHYSLIEE